MNAVFSNNITTSTVKFEEKNINSIGVSTTVQLIITFGLVICIVILTAITTFLVNFCKEKFDKPREKLLDKGKSVCTDRDIGFQIVSLEEMELEDTLNAKV